MIIKIDADKEVIHKKMAEKIIDKKRQNGSGIWSFTQSYKDKLIGEVKDDRFWLQKTKAFYTQIPQRYFTGKIIDCSDHVLIKGHFRYTSFTRALSILFWLVGLGGYTYFYLGAEIQNMDMLGWFRNIWQIALFIFICELITLVLSLLIYKKEENLTIKFLKSLDKDN